MKRKIFFALILLGIAVSCFSQEIIIEGEVPEDFFSKAYPASHTTFDRIELQWVPTDHVSVHPEWNRIESSVVNGSVKWKITADRPVFVYSPYLFNWVVFYPGDSVHIRYGKYSETARVSGSGAAAIELQLVIEKKIRGRLGPTANESILNSMADFYNWGKALDDLSASVGRIFKDAEKKVPVSRLDFIKLKTLYKMESYRATTFSALYSLMVKNRGLATNTRLAAVFDAVFNRPVAGWLRKQENYTGEVAYFYDYIRMKAMRDHGFDLDDEQINSPAKRRWRYYELIKTEFKGLLKERVMQYLVVRDLLNELRYADTVRINILKDYYAGSAFPNYKIRVKQYEEEAIAFVNQRLERDKQRARSNQTYLHFDGPYLFYSNNNMQLARFDSSQLSLRDFKVTDFIEVGTESYPETFRAARKKSLPNELSIYDRPQQLLVLSDIEGNFKAFRTLLQNNGIIDQNFNWTFGAGHLVFAGDMFDRGYQVTECLWLLYALEEKARAAGGYVHFILGNHEIMNMQGDHAYVQEKYKTNARILGKSLTELYNQDSELGRWLRTKNMVEKIGELLFVHGGISAEVNRLPLTIGEINQLARPYYGRSIDSANHSLLTLYDSGKGENYRISPFWSRGYYEGKILKVEQVDSTLEKFNVRRIVTGHTIVADTISVHYPGAKVINTDTRHAEGKSEALLIEGDHYYRVNAEGKRVLLFVDDKKKMGNENKETKDRNKSSQ